MLAWDWLVVIPLWKTAKGHRNTALCRSQEVWMPSGKPGNLNLARLGGPVIFLLFARWEAGDKTSMSVAVLWTQLKNSVLTCGGMRCVPLVIRRQRCGDISSSNVQPKGFILCLACSRQGQAAPTNLGGCCVCIVMSRHKKRKRCLLIPNFPLLFSVLWVFTFYPFDWNHSLALFFCE